MEIRSLQFDHLITFRIRDKKENWLEGIKVMEDFPLNHEVYKNGPVFFSFEVEEGDEGLFTFYLPINEAVEFDEGITDFAYLEQFKLEKSLLLRQAQEEVDFKTAIQKIKDYAQAQNLPTDDSFVCVLLEVYGEYMIDLYVPLKERSEVR
ncbi:biotin carboxylase [Ureibacillus composti]|nr:biotin carboxylase [Ureibacillus composti]